MMNNMEPYGGYGGPLRSYGRMYGGLDYDDVSIYALMIITKHVREMENRMICSVVNCG